MKGNIDKLYIFVRITLFSMHSGLLLLSPLMNKEFGQITSSLNGQPVQLPSRFASLKYTSLYT